MHIDDLTATHGVEIQARQAYRAKYKGGMAMAWVGEGIYIVLADKEGSSYRRLCSVDEARRIAAMLTEAADALDVATGADVEEG